MNGLGSEYQYLVKSGNRLPVITVPSNSFPICWKTSQDQDVHTRCSRAVTRRRPLFHVHRPATPHGSPKAGHRCWTHPACSAESCRSPQGHTRHQGHYNPRSRRFTTARQLQDSDTDDDSLKGRREHNGHDNQAGEDERCN